MIAKEGRKKELGCRDPRATVSQVGKKSRSWKDVEMTRKKKMVEILAGRKNWMASEVEILDAEERDGQSKKAKKGRK